MPGLLSGKTLRRGGSGQFIDLKGAQPQLPPTPTTSTGYTIVTTDKLVTSYASSLGNVQFASGQMYSNVTTTNLRLIGTETTSVLVSGGSVSTSTNTGALVVQGGEGIWGNLNVGGLTSLRDLIAINATVTTFHVTGTNISVSTTTGALIVDNGTAIGGNLFVWGNTVLTSITATILTATNATFVQAVVTNGNDSHDTSTGALVVAGGVGIGTNVNIGTTLNVGSTATFTTDLTVLKNAEFKGQVTVDGQGAVDISPQAASVYIRPTLGGSIIIQPSTPGSIDGMLIGGNLAEDAHFLNAYANNFIGLATTSTNIEKGLVGSIPYQTAPGLTSFIDIGAANTVLVSNGTTATWTNAANLEVTTSTYSKKPFINTSSPTIYHVILSTGTNNYAPLVEDTPLSYDASISTLQTTHLTATNTINVYGSVYSQEGIPQEYRLLYTPRSTISVGTPPGGARLGDFWIDPGQGATFQYVDDGGTKIWVQFTGL